MTGDPYDQTHSLAAPPAPNESRKRWVADRLMPSFPDAETAKVAGETGEAFVFRDFERSKITAIRRAIDQSPLRYSALFATMVAFWTVIMSAGAGLHGSNAVILNQTPNVALFSAVLGVFLYPWRLVWVPIAAFVLVFGYPFVNPLVSGIPWYRNPAVTPDLITKFYLVNLAAAVLIGLALRGFFFFARRMWRPHLADLALSIFAFFAFVLICMLQLQVTLGLADGLTPSAQNLLGFDDSLERLANNRIFRGGVVLTGFLLAAIELPNLQLFRLGLMAAMIYPMIAMLHSLGFTLYPMLDVALFTVILVIVLPVPAAAIGAIVGVAIYSGLTGAFLNDTLPSTAAEAQLETYSLLVLALIVFVLAFRSRTRHQLISKDSSMRRLNRVRDFAGVGLFSANLTLGRYRLDDAASRLLGCDNTGPLADLLQCFDITARDQLTTVLAKRAASGDMLTLPLERPHSGKIMLQVLVWSETAISGEDVTYGLFLDVTEDTQRKMALQTALDELSSRGERQRQMFSVVSHEVRTPASIISMLIDELPENLPGTVRTQLRETTDQLLAVLGDMRQAVNPEKNLPVRHDPYIPAQLAEAILAGLRHTAKKAGMTLHTDLDASSQTLREGDVVRSRQILTNLLRNALIHSQGTQATLSFRSAKSATGQTLSVWTVTDNGRGIPPEDVAGLFDPFERGGRDSRRRADGSGLGLFIARSAATVLGGTLDLHHPPLGGASFTVTLPEPELAASALGANAPVIGAKADPSLSVILAEDNPLVAEVMAARLRRDFHSVTIVSNGQALIDACATSTPGAVLTDLFMPGLDGDEATARLRANGYTGPIVGLTAAAVGEEAERFTRAGADAVLFKPLDMADLHRLLIHRQPARLRG